MSKANPKTDIRIMFRNVIERAGQREGFNIPDDFVFLDVLPKFAKKITKNPIYILWNGGDPKLNEKGGKDCIAWLYLEGNTIKGWSI